MRSSHARRQLIAPAASPEETAAIVAALEQFLRAAALPLAATAEAPDEWRRAAMLEGVEREPQADARDPWINT